MPIRQAPAAVVLAAALGLPATVGAQSSLHAAIEQRAVAVAPKVVTWRRDFHQHPELSNREVRTSGIVAAHLRTLGIEVRTGVAKTGVVGVLRGGRPGPVVALRADMDALPVTEEVDVPYRSRVRTQFGGQEVGVMHACGHDLHTASLMGAAEVLSGMREELPGTVVFIFQPAEEGAPPGERGGASVMIEEGALDTPKVDAIFGLHVLPTLQVGTIGVNVGAAMASSNRFTVTITDVPDTLPTITSEGGGAAASLNQPENNTYVTTVMATGVSLTEGLEDIENQMRKAAMKRVTDSSWLMGSPQSRSGAPSGKYAR